ncbi:AraC family transcriptional regulator [Lampropedia puyangensis]|uniref:AraC family transcriptional regulator n=1 Tax=Lampropedia puyangensis TaxID=1330072 RepID=A0A4S8F6V0_9BURK|nr:helix-turn-helix transcriptional regulator [Lampropedia puyangensis]THU01072.1 AraC family transcriptional regulator [Lampropedia puyangensis]
MGFSSSTRGGHALDLHSAETSPLPVTGVVEHYLAGHVVPAHQHRRGHLIYASSGVLLVQAASGRWLVPPTTAVWLRPGVVHQLTAATAMTAYGMLIDEAWAQQLPETDCVVHVTPLLRELIDALARVSHDAPLALRSQLLGQLFMEELKTVASLPFYLPWPEEGPMRQLCEGLMQEREYAQTASQWASRLAMTPKTLHRHFLKSTGMTFGQWRQTMRLMKSMPWLLQGLPITQVALESGYESHSAYCVAFKKHFDCSPSQFLTKLEPVKAPMKAN